MATSTLGAIISEVLETGEKRVLSETERQQFYEDFYRDVSEKIEDIRNDQRKAYEEGKNLILA
ncbi:hypothetical protein [Methylotenera sp.]|uniref:hypothetical protein n=1 Tax=Methylotenera sp. TaxID=2051956 RepID=UPI002EDB7EF4